MKYFYTLIMCMAFFAAGCGSNNNQTLTFSEKTNIDLQEHRGARGLFPENTIPAFKYAIENKMTTLKLDTNLTKDGNLIVYHDSIINSDLCIDSKGHPAQSIRILDMTVEDLKKLDCGSLVNEKFPEQTPVPGTKLISLPEFFDFVKQYEANHPDIPKLRFNVETKFEPAPNQEYLEKFADTMVKFIEDADVVDRTTVQSFVLEVLPMIKKRNPKLQTSFSFKPAIKKTSVLFHGQ
ncbi:MAG: glycerophosphodiester phosphodiesterase family protein [Deltaproteobacteria bacterium]|jgi:glycerophosphoryl diester phosphodiesterase|nr:glycerophosphodiester phosphodiesterase family protein [Deltaproteobacteria bacterium]